MKSAVCLYKLNKIYFYHDQKIYLDKALNLYIYLSCTFMAFLINKIKKCRDKFLMTVQKRIFKVPKLN